MAQHFLDLISKQRLALILGVAGVDRHDNKRSKQWCRFFTATKLIVAFWLMIQWQIDSVGTVPGKVRLLASLIVWLYFLFEFSTMLKLTDDRTCYIKRNWLFIPILVCGVGYIYLFHLYNLFWLRDLQPLLALCIMLPSGRMLLHYFKDGKLGTTLFASCIIVITFGLLVAGVDPDVKSPWDGVWWAIATVSTVGYGDVVPTSALGRIIGAALVVMGLGMFVIITANFLAVFLRRETRALDRSEKEIDALMEEVQTIKNNQERILKILEKNSMK